MQEDIEQPSPRLAQIYASKRRKPWAQTSHEGTSWAEVQAAFPNDDAVLDHVFHTRFGQYYPCAKCGKPTKWYRIRNYRRYGSNCCGSRSLHPLAGTVFGATRVPLTDWLHIMLLTCNDRSGTPAHFIQRHFGLTYNCAYKICDRVRTHMALVEGVRQIGGPGQHVYVDEALLRGVTTPGRKGSGRAIVMGMSDGEAVATAIIPDRRTETLLEVIHRRVRPGSILVTDGFSSYRRLDQLGWERSVVNHSQNIYVNHEGYSQAAIESYWGALKRMMRSSHLHVSRLNLWKYLGEFNFRYSRRNRSHETFWDVLDSFPTFTRDVVPPPGLDYCKRPMAAS